MKRYYFCSLEGVTNFDTLPTLSDFWELLDDVVREDTQWLNKGRESIIAYEERRAREEIKRLPDWQILAEQKLDPYWEIIQRQGQVMEVDWDFDKIVKYRDYMKENKNRVCLEC